MGDLKKHIALISLGVLLSSCIGKNFKNLISELDNDTSDNVSIVAETFSEIEFIEDEDGSTGTHKIGENRSDFTIFLFSSASCLSCAKEHQEISDRLKGEKPEGFEIYSFMTKVDPITNKNILMEKKKQWRITWPFTGDPDNSMHQAFCEGVQVPCTIVFDKTGKVRFRKTGEVHVEDLENLMKLKIGTDPLPPGDYGDNAFFGRFIEDTKMFGQKGEDGEITFSEMELSKDLERPLLLVLASRFCSACEEEHEKLVSIYNSANTTLKEVDIITAVMPIDSTSEEGQEELKKDWINKFNIPWPVTGLYRNQISKYLENYCRPGDPDLWDLTPCTALFVPGKGIVMQRGEVSESLVLSTIRKHLEPVHFEENIEAITEIPEKAEDATFETTSISSERDDRPVVLIYAGNSCSACIEEHKQLVELHKDPDSFVHQVRFVSLVVGYNMDNDSSRNNFVQTWKIDFKVPWEMAIIKGQDLGKSMDKYCKDPIEDNQGIAPCTSIFTQKYGKVFERSAMHVEDIGKAVNGEEIPPFNKDDHGDLDTFSTKSGSSDKED